MSKLTPPSMKNRARRKKFFEEHSELPNAVAELLRIENLKKFGQFKITEQQSVKYLKKSKDEFLNNLKIQRFLNSKKIKTKGAFGKKADYLIKRVELEVV